ncbi:MAG: glycosyltransferase [Oscillospiraceae bacterium]|nr:glycosyltransferase [Oscillospiraceae bacterium]
MDVFLMTLQITRNAISVAVSLYLFYQLFIALFGLKRPQKAEIIPNRQHRFAIIIAARNEQDVIAYLIESLKQQNYPSELFDIIVVADNCTDYTAEVARSCGALTFERFNNREVGKGFALHWIFDILLKEYPEKYDAMCVFDADNLADAEFLGEMNRQLCAGHQIVQGYRCAKNPRDSLVSGYYAIYWSTLCRFYYLPRTRLGLSAFVGGTGFCFCIDIIKETGWQTKTMSEDSEFSLQNIIAGRRVIYAHEAVFYDDQPTEFSQSLTQRRRWVNGTFQCIRYEGRKMAHGLSTKGYRLRLFDAMMCLATLPMLGLATVGLIAHIIVTTLNSEQILNGFGLLLLSAMLALFLVHQIPALFLFDKKTKRPTGMAILTFPIFLLSYGVVVLSALIFPRTTWKPIRHNRGVTMEELNKEG